eukprot:763117-Hanusia_phi.AAC.5
MDTQVWAVVFARYGRQNRKEGNTHKSHTPVLSSATNNHMSCGESSRSISRAAVVFCDASALCDSLMQSWTQHMISNAFI